MKIKPRKVVGNIPAGDYEGVIREQYESHDGKGLWLKLEVEGKEELLLVSISVNGSVLNNFAAELVDENGEVDTEEWVDSVVRFSVVDRQVGTETFSRVTHLEPILED